MKFRFLYTVIFGLLLLNSKQFIVPQQEESICNPFSFSHTHQHPVFDITQVNDDIPVSALLCYDSEDDDESSTEKKKNTASSYSYFLSGKISCSTSFHYISRYKTCFSLSAYSYIFQRVLRV